MPPGMTTLFTYAMIELAPSRQTGGLPSIRTPFRIPERPEIAIASDFQLLIGGIDNDADTFAVRPFEGNQAPTVREVDAEDRNRPVAARHEGLADTLLHKMLCEQETAAHGNRFQVSPSRPRL